MTMAGNQLNEKSPFLQTGAVKNNNREPDYYYSNFHMQPRRSFSYGKQKVSKNNYTNFREKSVFLSFQFPFPPKNNQSNFSKFPAYQDKLDRRRFF